MDILGRGRSITSERGLIFKVTSCCLDSVIAKERCYRASFISVCIGCTGTFFMKGGENRRRRTHDDEHTTTNTRRQTHNDDTYFHTILLIWNHVDKYEWTGRDQFLHPIPITVTTNKTIWGLSECYDL